MTGAESHIEKLKGRLAAGEITVAEYERLLDIISDKSSSESINTTKKPASDQPLLEIKNKEHGAILLFHDRITTARNTRRLEEIKSIRYIGYILGVSFIPHTKSTSVSIEFTDSEKLYINEDRLLTSFGSHKALSKFYSYIAQQTFQARSDFLVEKLRSSGKLLLCDLWGPPPVHLSKDGILSNRDISIDLKNVRRSGKGIMLLGAETRFGYGGLSRSPDWVRVSEDGSKGAKGEIGFEVHKEDRDVVHNLLGWFSIEGNYL